ncbi:MAG TPA: hypothetical protein VLX64_04285, partial [Thermoplasmata archaeon]|nr:hypothetical protein [Thermoplasmata archaeon]
MRRSGPRRSPSGRPRAPARNLSAQRHKKGGPRRGRRERAMLVEMTELMGRQIYTPDGRLLGEVDNL